MAFDYYAFHFILDPSLQEPLLGLLSELPFESFEETEDRLLAYLPASVAPESLTPELETIKEQIPFQLSIELLEGQNWNEIWESNFSPILVGSFCGIRAEFHPSFGSEVRHELCIQPRMAFGTGHHETTYMMIETMEILPLSNADVLDYGAGTGILAILAARLGARTVDALEIEAIACENARENCQANATDLVNVVEGTLEKVLGRQYDIVLANINRHVLLESFAPLYGMLRAGGILLISGILSTDREIVEDASLAAGFQTTQIRAKGQWIAVQLHRN